MIHPMNKIKVQYGYTLREILKYGLNQLETPYTADYPKANTTIFTRSIFSSYGVDFPTTTLIPNKYLDETRLDLLNGIIERFKGGPVGLEAVASAIGEEVMTLEDVSEPYLLQIGFINRTPRGRVATEKAYEHLKKSFQMGF